MAEQRRCVNYHRWAWKRVIEQAFGWNAFYLMAGEEGKTAGVLPLVLEKAIATTRRRNTPMFNTRDLRMTWWY